MLIRKLVLLSLLFNVFGSELLAQEPKQEVNILLLGKSGAGKSSLVNIFYNHLKGRSYGDDLDIVIPLKHRGRDIPVTVEAYKQYGVRVNEDGQSQTEEVLKYTVETKKLIVNFWDTPGLPDTRGPEKDKEHLVKIRNILASISFNAIAVVFPPDGLALQSQEFVSTMSSIVGILPKTYAGNIFGIVNRTIGENIDDDTRADYKSKLSAVFGITDPKKVLPGYYFDGSSFFNKTPKGYENWAADDRVITEIIDRVRSNSATGTQDAVKLQSLLSILEAKMEELNECIRDGSSIRQKLQDAWNNLSHEKRVKYSDITNMLTRFFMSMLFGEKSELSDLMDSEIVRNAVAQKKRQKSILDEIALLQKQRRRIAMTGSPDPILKIVDGKLLEIELSALGEEYKSRLSEPYQYIKRAGERIRAEYL